MTPSSPLSSSVLRACDYRRMRWKNGAGWTAEIVRMPDREDWDWRLSIAEIDADARFSAFPGVERELVLLSGNGLRLRFDDGEVYDVLPPRQRVRFAGERAAAGELLDGPTRDFNLMWRRGAVEATLWHRPLVGSMVLFLEPGHSWAVHMVAGRACFADGSGLAGLDPGDTALLVAGGSRRRHVIEGGGELLLVRIAGGRVSSAGSG